MMADEYDPTAIHGAPARRKAADEPTIQIRLSDGTVTPPATLSQMKEAVSMVRGERRTKPGHEVSSNGVARDQLRAFVERIERLEEEKKTIADDIKDVYGEAKGMGFDTKILKKVIRLRAMDERKRQEEDAILDTYLHALGMISGGDE